MSEPIDTDFVRAEVARLAGARWYFRLMKPILFALCDEVDRLRAALGDAIECVESWSAYASPYYQEKHGLANDLDRLRAALDAPGGES